MATAYLTVDHSGDLTRRSTVTVTNPDGTETEIAVPRRGMFWERVDAALATAGWRVAAGAHHTSRFDDRGRLSFAIEKVGRP
jgi:hypothetical protein